MCNKKLYYINIIFNLVILLYTFNIILNLNNLTNEYFVNFLSFNFVIDRYNILFIILTNLICFSCTLYSYMVSKFSYNLNTLLLLFLQLCLVLAFSINNILLFFVFFESILLPFFVYIAFFGSRGRKANAIMLLVLFTIASSIFIFIGIFVIFYHVEDLNFINIINFEFQEIERTFILYCFFFGFMAKVPMLPVHIWLTEAHVEAPTVGSVILAAIVLKLGFYGLIRVLYVVNFFILPFHFIILFALICICSTLYCSILALRQVDIKKIIAYSSIVHMNIGMLGLCSSSYLGHNGSLFVMFSHGLISSSMFFFVGFLYERFHTRNLMYFGGLVQYMPTFSILFFFILISNMSFPGTCNFIGEFFIFYTIFSEFTFTFFIVCIFTTTLTSFFCIIIFAKVCFFQVSGFLKYNLKDLNFTEGTLGILLSILILLFGILPNLIFIILF